MNADQYIRLVIRKHMIKKEAASRARSTAMQLRPWIKQWAGNNLHGIYPSGSFAKGTNVIDGTDIDLFISLRHTTPHTLKDIYDSLSNYLEQCGFSVREQHVSIRVNYKNLSIDLVPAKREKGPTNDHSIYRKKAGTWTKTNVHKHVLQVKKSGRLNEIRAMKIWRNRHRLEFPSFYLELSIIEALRRRPLRKLSSNLCRVFEYFTRDFENARIVDPSNSNNVVSDDLTIKEKQSVARAALSSLLKKSWHQIIW